MAHELLVSVKTLNFVFGLPGVPVRLGVTRPLNQVLKTRGCAALIEDALDTPQRFSRCIVGQGRRLRLHSIRGLAEG
jgi:hypothetical protein